MRKVNPYIPSFGYADNGKTVFHAAYGLVEVTYIKNVTHEDDTIVRVRIGYSEYCEEEIEINYDINGYIRSLGITPKSKHPTIFRSQEQCKKYWMWEHRHREKI